MKRKIASAVAALLCVVLMCSVFTGCSTGADIDFQLDGVCMNSSDFTAFYNGEKTLEECTTQPCQLAVSNWSIHNDEVGLYLNQVRGKLYQMSSILGRLFADKTQTDDGKDVTVGFLLDTLGDNSNINSISVVLFQIWNSTEPDDSLLLHKELSGQPHLKFYTADEDGVLYFYEAPLPDTLKDIHNTGLEAVDNYDTWYEDVMQNNGSVDVEG